MTAQARIAIGAASPMCGFRFASPRNRERVPMPNSAPLQLDDPSLSMALALVCTSPTPLLLLNGGSKITAVSASFCKAFGIDARSLSWVAESGTFRNFGR
jgi:hypothetical protein